MKTTNYLMAMLIAGAGAVSAQDAAKTEADSTAAQAVTTTTPSDAEESVKTEPKAEEKEQEKKGKSEKSDKDKKLTPYPLDTCIVTDNKLGSMGDPLTIKHENQEIKLCCKPCEKKFKKDPEKYLIKLKPDA